MVARKGNLLNFSNRFKNTKKTTKSHKILLLWHIFIFIKKDK